MGLKKKKKKKKTIHTLYIYIINLNMAEDDTVLALRRVLTSETEPLGRRFRALFSLKHFACLQPPSERTLPAIEAIAAGFSSSSALLKHELAYCLGQSRNLKSVQYLQQAVQDKGQDVMCRHEAAEALGALGDPASLDMLKELRDSGSESHVIRETCDIAVDRILWENSEERKLESLRPRYGLFFFFFFFFFLAPFLTKSLKVILPPSTLLLHSQ